MKLDQLTYFLETARQEHLGRAAKILSISPSAISHSIAALEEELGQTLFEKRGRRICLTTRGKALKEKAQHLLYEVEAIRRELKADPALEGYFRLGASHVLGDQLLVSAWDRVQAEHKKLSGELLSLRSADVIRGVKEGSLDFGLCFSPQAHPSLKINPLYRGHLRIYVRKRHPLFELKNPVKKLDEFPAVLPKAFEGVDVCQSHPVFEKQGIRPKVTLAYDNYAVAARKVAISDAWGFFPDLITKWFDSVVPLKLPQHWKAPYTVSSVFSTTRPLPQALAVLNEELTKLILSDYRRGA